MSTAVAEPPVKAAPFQTGSSVPSGKGVIHVTPGGMSATPAPPAAAAVKTPSARETMESKLALKIKPGTGVDVTPEKPLGDVKAPPTDGTSAPEDVESAVEKPADGTTGSPEDGSAKAAAKPKVNPWKLADEHKSRASKLEQEIVELKKLVPNEAARKSEMAEVEQIKTRNKELEDEIRYVNYAKSPEFKTKYQEPYDKAWTRAMSELKEITVQDADGDSRSVTPTDMLNLVNAPLGKAREMANNLFGDFADDVMAHRKEIKNLFESQSSALEEARTNGAEREKKLQTDLQTKMSSLHSEVAETWAKANEAATKDEKYGAMFIPTEGDQDGNQRLAKGFELVDRAFRENPMDTKLTPEERASVIKRHAAVRNRAAAFGRMLYQNNQLKERISALEKELGQFRESTPTTSGGQQPKPASGPMSARESLEQGLAKLAK